MKYDELIYEVVVQAHEKRSHFFRTSGKNLEKIQSSILTEEGMVEEEISALGEIENVHTKKLKRIRRGF